MLPNGAEPKRGRPLIGLSLLLVIPARSWSRRLGGRLLSLTFIKRFGWTPYSPGVQPYQAKCLGFSKGLANLCRHHLDACLAHIAQGTYSGAAK
jgi:hypothetical protein